MKEFFKRQGLHLFIATALAFVFSCAAAFVYSSSTLNLIVTVFICERLVTSRRIRTLAKSFFGHIAAEFVKAGSTASAKETSAPVSEQPTKADVSTYPSGSFEKVEAAVHALMEDFQFDPQMPILEDDIPSCTFCDEEHEQLSL